jgi:pimeloyl-ACP methyl ester carboxylesterase
MASHIAGGVNALPAALGGLLDFLETPHGINAAASAYEVKPLFDHYASRRPVYAIDLPGYGLSDRAERAYTPRVMTDAVLALAAEIGARHPGRPIDAIGVSLSCEYVARAAVEVPLRFRTVCLVSATGLNRTKRFDGPPGSTRGKAWLLSLLGRAPWSAGLFRTLTRPAVIRFFLEKTWGSKDIDIGLLEYDLLTVQMPGASNAPFWFLSAFLFSADISRVYESIAVPVLLVHGTKGDFTDYRGAPRLRDEFGWRIVVMPTGAMPYFEDLETFVRAYDAFIDEALA